MTEQEYISKLETETGLSLEKGDFGFIMGRSTPFTSHQDFQSANQEAGYIVWRKHLRPDGSNYYREIRTPGLSFEETKNFLMLDDEDLSKYLKKTDEFLEQHGFLVGEFDKEIFNGNK